jgi:dTDP-4-amino-4,6-dideoxygalactose transaminase
MKSGVEDFAVFGGAPAFATALHVGRPNLGRRDRLFDRLNDLLDRRWLSNEGPYVQEFETALACRLGVRHAIAVANGTVGLDIAIRAVGLSGEIIVPSFTFVATSHVLLSQGLTPVFCDVDPATHNLSPERVEALITQRVTGIIGVHIWGRASAVDELDHIARCSGRRTFVLDDTFTRAAIAWSLTTRWPGTEASICPPQMRSPRACCACRPGQPSMSRPSKRFAT